MFEDEDDPLEDLYEDGSDFDRERLSKALDGIIGIDSENGAPIYKENYKDLSNKEQFVTQLLYRKAGVLLGELDDSKIGITSSEAAKSQDVSSRSIVNYGSDLDFVDHDEDRGGYYLRDYAISNAINFISTAQGD